MAEYIPSPVKRAADQVALYEGSGGVHGTTLGSGPPVIIVTHQGNKTGAVRKTPLMRVKDGDNYMLVGSRNGAPTHPVWVYNLRADPRVRIQDKTVVSYKRVREVQDADERARLWALAVKAFPPYENCQSKTERLIPVFLAEPA